MKDEILDEEEIENVKQIVDGGFMGVRSFVISENKVILWSKHKILHGTLS